MKNIYFCQFIFQKYAFSSKYAQKKCLWKNIFYMIAHDWRKVNAPYYCQQNPLTEVEEEMSLSPSEVLVPHDNSRSHIADLTKEQLKNVRKEILEHPLYSSLRGKQALEDYNSITVNMLKTSYLSGWWSKLKVSTRKQPQSVQNAQKYV